jgi:hypothetical protein
MIIIVSPVSSSFKTWDDFVIEVRGTMMKRLIEAAFITLALAIVANPTLLTIGVSFFQVSGQQVGIHSENIALDSARIQSQK